MGILWQLKQRDIVHNEKVLAHLFIWWTPEAGSSSTPWEVWGCQKSVSSAFVICKLTCSPTSLEVLRLPKQYIVGTMICSSVRWMPLEWFFLNSVSGEQLSRICLKCVCCLHSYLCTLHHGRPPIDYIVREDKNLFLVHLSLNVGKCA